LPVGAEDWEGGEDKQQRKSETADVSSETQELRLP
jgi:hypothetical protein